MAESLRRADCTSPASTISLALGALKVELVGYLVACQEQLLAPGTTGAG